MRTFVQNAPVQFTVDESVVIIPFQQVGPYVAALEHLSTTKEAVAPDPRFLAALNGQLMALAKAEIVARYGEDVELITVAEWTARQAATAQSQAPAPLPEPPAAPVLDTNPLAATLRAPVQRPPSGNATPGKPTAGT